MRLLALVFAFVAAPLAAHEYWIEPQAYQIPANGQLVADLVNGEEFKGSKLAYIPQRFVHFVAVMNGKVAPVPGRVGDMPALTMDLPTEGLAVVAYQSRNLTVDYEEWEKFKSFVKHKDLGDAEAMHTARGFAIGGLTEVYSRYSKSLVAVGAGGGEDVRTGLTTELVALTNPYTDDVSDGIRVQLFYLQNVRANTQVEVFEKAPDGSVAQAFYRTDSDGIATIPVKAGHTYMADAVVLREPKENVAADTGAVWETLWANLTWAVPN